MPGSPQVVTGYTAISGRCPQSGKTVDFLLALEFARQVQRHQPYWKFMAIGSLSEILTNPTSAYHGLQREGFDDGYCYFGKPRNYYPSPRIETPFPAGFVLGVSFSWDERGFIILDWEKRREGELGCPVNAETDFRGPQCIPN